MLISLIVAMSENQVIGKNNHLPWHLPADLRHFKEITMGKPIIMGRKTFESIGKPLPGRRNIIVTHDRDYSVENCEIVHSLYDAIELVKDAEEIMIIGGGKIFSQILPQANRIYLTLVHAVIAGDAYFLNYDETEWRQISRSDFQKDEKNEYDYSFILLERIQDTLNNF